MYSIFGWLDDSAVNLETWSHKIQTNRLISRILLCKRLSIPEYKYVFIVNEYKIFLIFLH
jgi:hypothetical protein